MSNLEFCLCKNKDADQLCSNCRADQRLYFRFLDCTILLLNLSEISSLLLSYVAVQLGLLDLVGNHNVGFLMSWLI